MNLKTLLRGPSRPSIVVGQKSTYSRIGLSKQFRPVQHVSIDYTPIEIYELHFFPWIRGRSTRVWHLKVMLRCENGRTFNYVLAADGDIDTALQYGYLTGIQKALSEIREEVLLSVKVG